MTRLEFETLLDKYLTGDASESDEQLVEQFYEELQTREKGWDSFSQQQKEELRIQIYQAIQREKGLAANQSTKPHVFKWVYRMAAAAVVTLGVGIAYFLNPSAPQITYVTKSTSSGQKATIKLSDGSVVRLNSESSITYPSPLAIDERVIQLEGEAFFDVSEDKNRPFIVNAHDVRTTVLGTSFDVNAYNPSSISVSLVSGKVKVNTLSNDPASEKQVFLKPGESASYSSVDGTIAVSPFDKMKLTGWKDGVIYISDAGYEEIFKQLSRWYGVSFKYMNKPGQMWNYSGQFQDMSLEVVLNTIGFSEGFIFEIQENVVEIEFEN